MDAQKEEQENEGRSVTTELDYQNKKVAQSYAGPGRYNSAQKKNG